MKNQTEKTKTSTKKLKFSKKVKRRLSDPKIKKQRVKKPKTQTQNREIAQEKNQKSLKKAVKKEPLKLEMQEASKDLDLNESDQEFISEMMQELDDEESLLDAPTEPAKGPSRAETEDGIRVIEIDDEFAQRITRRCEQGSKPVTRLCIQIFNSVFNENAISGDSRLMQRKYVIFDPDVMKRFLQIYFEQVPQILSKVAD